MGMTAATWVVVLVKDFGDAKQRLGPALDAVERRALAKRNAERAIRAAVAAPHRLVVAGSDEVAALAGRLGAEVLVEPRQEGQNPAAQRGIQQALALGAGAVLLLSSDLPLVNRRAIGQMLNAAAATSGPVAMAAPAIGRGGTNALYLRPPGVIGLHFGGDSLALFRQDAQSKDVPFLLHRSPALALDLDEPVDLARLRRAV
jgi:2-phospho-L-lactate/phosphoenolpyruvate guanylyltransferase